MLNQYKILTILYTKKSEINAQNNGSFKEKRFVIL